MSVRLWAIAVMLLATDAAYARGDAPPGGSILDKRHFTTDSVSKSEAQAQEIIPIPADETPWTDKTRRKRTLPAFDPWGVNESLTHEADAPPAMRGVNAEDNPESRKQIRPLQVKPPKKALTLAFDREQQAIDAEHKLLLEQYFDTNRKIGRFILNSYAGARGDFPGEDRRIALKRALNVRAYLIQLGYAQQDITIRALGNTGNTAPEKERIEIYTSI